MRIPSLSPEYNLHRAAEERGKAERCADASTRQAHLELAAIFEQRAADALHAETLH